METKARIDVLYASLTMEKLVGSILGQLLNIDNENSKTLGHKGTSLTFKNKVDLITDIKAMEREDAKKFEYLAEIRNQFLHNLDVDTFERCFGNLEGREKGYRKLYEPSDTTGLSNEEVLSKCFDAHFMDLKNVVEKLFGLIYEKTYKLGFADGSKRTSDLIIESLIEFKYESADYEMIFNKIIDRTEIKIKAELKDIK